MRIAMRNAILPLIRQAERIMAIAHIAPDGDCIGSLLALGHALKVLDKQVALVCADPLPDAFDFLPGHGLVTQDPHGDFDLLISLDSSDIERMGAAYPPAAYAGIPLINIDHHATNVHYGTVSWVETSASSTAELVFDLIEEMAVPVTPGIALCLLTGIVTDTRCFRTSNTTVRTLSSATSLMQAGASISQITEQVMNRRPLAEIKLWGAALNELKTQGRVIWVCITEEMRRQSGANSQDAATGLVSFITSAREADVGIVFTEKPDQLVEVGFRSVPGVDISQVAFRLGGGGHAQASGCTLGGSMDEVVAQVLAAVETSLPGVRS
jgi:phosphoesterase RecJ-like protein